MKKIILFLCLSSLYSCAKPVEKPKLSVSEYNRQAVIMKGVIQKILVETDYKKMHEIALAVESSRAVDCVAIVEECNIYGEILNTIVSSSENSLPKDSVTIAIYKRIGELDVAFKKGQDQLDGQWKIYINAHGSEGK